MGIMWPSRQQTKKNTNSNVSPWPFQPSAATSHIPALANQGFRPQPKNKQIVLEKQALPHEASMGQRYSNFFFFQNPCLAMQFIKAIQVFFAEFRFSPISTKTRKKKAKKKKLPCFGAGRTFLKILPWRAIASSRRSSLLLCF